MVNIISSETLDGFFHTRFLLFSFLKLSTTGGTSDARFIRKIAPCLEFGLVGKTMHKVGECVSLSDLKRLTLIYTKILDNYFK